MLSIFFLFVTFELIRKQTLREKYSLLWLFTGGVILIVSVFPYFFLSRLFARFTGLYYLSAVVVIAFIFLLVIVFHFSIVISQLTDQNRDLAQRYALLELDFKELKQRLLPSE
jgi:hypothetical protein